MAFITRNQNEIVMKRCGGDHCVDGLKRYTGPRQRSRQPSPSFRNLLVERKDATSEPGANGGEKRLMARFLCGATNALNAVTNFSQSQHAEIQTTFVDSLEPRNRTWVWTRLGWLGDDVRVEQITGQRSIFRPRSRGSRSGISIAPNPDNASTSDPVGFT